MRGAAQERRQKKREDGERRTETGGKREALYVLACVVFLIMVLSVVTAFVPVTFDFAVLYPFLLGGILLAVGVIWLRLEKATFLP